MDARETKLARMRNFNAVGAFGYTDTDGVVKGGNHHPDRCRCQGNPEPDPSLDTGRDAVGRGSCGPTGDTTPHKHREGDERHGCARCRECDAYQPMIPLLRLGECEVCLNSRAVQNGMPMGVDCLCGRHFHIGVQLLVDPEHEVECPSCTRSATVGEIAQQDGEQTVGGLLEAAAENTVHVAPPLEEIAMTHADDTDAASSPAESAT